MLHSSFMEGHKTADLEQCLRKIQLAGTLCGSLTWLGIGSQSIHIREDRVECNARNNPLEADSLLACTGWLHTTGVITAHMYRVLFFRCLYNTVRLYARFTMWESLKIHNVEKQWAHPQRHECMQCSVWEGWQAADCMLNVIKLLSSALCKEWPELKLQAMQ